MGRNGTYEKPVVERFGSFRELTRLGGCRSEHNWVTWGCHDDGGGKGDTGRS